MKSSPSLALALLAVLLSASAPVRERFSAAETQQVSIETPGLFARSRAFSVDFTDMRADDYSFPLPVGKARAAQDGQSLEIVSARGDAVRAMFAGEVRLSRSHASQGNVVVIRHPNGLETVYAGNAQNLVRVGDRVRAGQTVAIIGTREGVTACRFSVMVNGARINPLILVDMNSHRLRRQTLVFEKRGQLVSVRSEGGERQPEGVTLDPDVAEDPFATASTFRLALDEIAPGHWAYPLPGAKVISPYGGRRRHSGVDLKTKPQDEIVAAFDGVVTRSGPYAGYGNCIQIRHAYGLSTLYSHQHKNLVKAGDHVRAGQAIGLTGRTGRATTEHLHFELFFQGRRLDPAIMFDHAGHCLRHATLTLTSGGRVTRGK